MARMLRRTVGIVVVVVASVLTLSAQSKQPYIVAAVISADQSTLIVTGSNFPTNPSVTLDGMLLGGVQVDAAHKSVTAVMPALQPGTYLLEIGTGNFYAEFDLAVGAAGPSVDRGRAIDGIRGHARGVGARGETGAGPFSRSPGARSMS